MTTIKDVNFVRLNEHDNVVVLTSATEAGATVSNCAVKDDIPPAHKMATSEIPTGSAVIKYGQIIGYATEDIHPGQHVHSHNLEFRSVDVEADVGSVQHMIELPEGLPTTFQGYQRKNGATGTRNFIAVLTSVNCSATAAHMIAAAFYDDQIAQEYPNVDGVAAFSHGTGCGLATNADGFANLQRVLWGYATNPNVGGVLFVGLGCEVNQIDFLLEAYGLQQGPTVQVLNIQNSGGLRKTVEAGVEIVRSMLPDANGAKRTECHVSKLAVALQCGGSDGWSGITANPALGYASDLIAAAGGSTLLAETPEVYGAQHLLTSRATNQAAANNLIKLLSWWEHYTKINDGSMDNNPSPGNKRGGLTTILEKSLGAVAKGGTAPFQATYRYGEKIKAPGFSFMDSPGYDPASITGQIASGCNMVAFTTGRGSAFGSKPAPTIKVSSNDALWVRQEEDIDVNAGTIVSQGKTIEELGTEIYLKILDVASGTSSKSEAQGLGDHEFVPWQVGAVM